MVVAAMVSIVSAVALAGTREIVALAKFRADRARLFLEVASVRDESGDRRRCQGVTMVPPSTLTVFTRPGPLCAGGDVPLRTESFPSLTFTASGSMVFIGGAKFSGPILRVTDGVNPGNSDIDVHSDGRMFDNWGEFGEEGVLEAVPCDVDDLTLCGK